MVLKKSDVQNHNYFNITEDLQTVWRNPKFSYHAVSQADIARKWQDGEISEDIFEIIHFLYQAKFSTADQVSRALGVEVTDEILDALINSKLVNCLVLSNFQDSSELKVPDALKIYVVDFAGIYLLNCVGVDTSKWRFTDYYAGVRVIKKSLIMSEVLVAFKHTKNYRLRKEFECGGYEKMPEFKLNGGDTVSTDFGLRLERNQGGVVSNLNLIGYVAEPGYEDIFLTENIRNLDIIFHQTKVGQKYYPLEGDTLPRLCVIVQDSSIPDQIQRVAKIIGRTSEFAGANVLIFGYNEMVAKGLSDTSFYSLRTVTDQSNSRSVQVGRVQVAL